jgi:hypothetical protein
LKFNDFPRRIREQALLHAVAARTPLFNALPICQLRSPLWSIGHGFSLSSVMTEQLLLDAI